jgi:hypothetical protein
VTKLLGGKGLLDHRIAAIKSTVGLLGCQGARHQQHTNFGAQKPHATGQLEAAHSLHVRTDDECIDLELGFPAAKLTRRAVGGVEDAVSLRAERAEERCPMVVVVVHEDDAVATHEG